KLGQNLALVGDRCVEDKVERGNPVGRHQEQQPVVSLEQFPDLARVQMLQHSRGAAKAGSSFSKRSKTAPSLATYRSGRRTSSSRAWSMRRPSFAACSASVSRNGAPVSQVSMAAC